MTDPAPQPEPKYCTEKCNQCKPIHLIDGDDSYICVVDGHEVIPCEIDLTPGVGQTPPYDNTICEHDTRRSRPATAQIDLKKCFDDLAYATGRWKIYRQDAGMGEVDYCVLRNDDFFCRANDLDIAKDICAAYDKKSLRNAPTAQVLDDICKNCGAKEYGACVGTDCPCGSYESHIPREEQGS